jgi:hypothetical protein
MIKVCKWWDEFENATSRKLVTIRHFNCPSGNDSKGYRTLMREGKDGVAALGVFQALAQCLASLGKKARERGEFINSDATNLEINDISDLTRIPKVHLEAGIKTLVGIGWLSHMEPRISQSSPIVPQQSPTDPPSSPNGEERIGGERIGEDRSGGEGVSCPIPDDCNLDSLPLKLNSISRNWTIPKLSSKESIALAANRDILESIPEAEWETLRRYYSASLPEGAAYYRPATRQRLLDDFGDVHAHAMRWESKQAKPRAKRKRVEEPGEVASASDIAELLTTRKP